MWRAGRSLKLLASGCRAQRKLHGRSWQTFSQKSPEVSLNYVEFHHISSHFIMFHHVSSHFISMKAGRQWTTAEAYSFCAVNVPAFFPGYGPLSQDFLLLREEHVNLLGPFGSAKMTAPCRTCSRTHQGHPRTHSDSSNSSRAKKAFYGSSHFWSYHVISLHSEARPTAAGFGA